MTFSFSAPRFTEADERYEQANLTEEERLEAWNDIYGKTSLIQETPQMQAAACLEMERELLQIPNKEAYLHALSTSPEVVRHETPFIRFLRCEQFNTKRAAERLVKNWAMRKILFGDRAFLPMTLEGGCLSPQDVESLRLGHFLPLPPDKYGRTVIYESRGHLDDTTIDYSSLLRAQWYVFHVALEQDSTGIVLLANNKSTLPNHFSRKHVKLLWTSLSKCLPVQVRAIHCCYPKSFMELFLPLLKNILGRKMRLRHVVHEHGDVCALEQYGFNEESLPPAFMGTYKLDPKGWVKERILLEQGRPRICSCHRSENDTDEMDITPSISDKQLLIHNGLPPFKSTVG